MLWRVLGECSGHIGFPIWKCDVTGTMLTAILSLTEECHWRAWSWASRRASLWSFCVVERQGFLENANGCIWVVLLSGMLYYFLRGPLSISLCMLSYEFISVV